MSAATSALAAMALAGSTAAIHRHRGAGRKGGGHDQGHVAEADLAEVVDALPLGRQHLLMFAAAALGVFAIGGLSDPIGLAFPGFQASWGPLAPSSLAAAASSASAGQVLAAVFAGGLSDRFGRRAVSRYATLLCLGSFLLCVSAPSLEVLTFARLLGGLGCGANLVALPTMLSECIPSRYPRLLVLYQVCWPLAASIFAFVLHDHGWRWAVATGIPASVLLALLLFLPRGLVESPRFLLARGRREEAQAALVRLGHGRPEALAARAAGLGSASAGQPKLHTAKQVPGPGSRQPWAGLYPLLLLGFLCHGVPSQLVKVWLPTVLARLGSLGSAASEGAFEAMWDLECVGILTLGIVCGGRRGKAKAGGSAALAQQLPVSLLAFLISACAVLANLGASGAVLVGFLGAVHLMCQAAAYNFLMPFAAACFPPVARARRVSGLLIANYAGGFAGPGLGSLLLQGGRPALGAAAVLRTAAGIYGLGALAVLVVMRWQRRQQP